MTNGLGKVVNHGWGCCCRGCVDRRCGRLPVAQLDMEMALDGRDGTTARCKGGDSERREDGFDGMTVQRDSGSTTSIG